MELNCSDGKLRQFIPLSDKLCKLGLSPELLNHDCGFIMLTLRPDIGFFKAFRLARQNLLSGVSNYVAHYSKKSRRKNATHFHVSKLTSDVKYIAFLPAIWERKELDITSDMDLITKLARLISRLAPTYFGVNNSTATIQTFIHGIEIKDLKPCFGYRVVTDEFLSEDNTRYLLLEDENNVQFAADLSVLGYTNAVMVCD